MSWGCPFLGIIVTVDCFQSDGIQFSAKQRLNRFKITICKFCGNLWIILLDRPNSSSVTLEFNILIVFCSSLNVIRSHLANNVGKNLEQTIAYLKPIRLSTHQQFIQPIQELIRRTVQRIRIHLILLHQLQSQTSQFKKHPLQWLQEYHAEHLNTEASTARWVQKLVAQYLIIFSV